MAVINFANREITARIVYVGATGAGCNTNVRRLYTQLTGSERSRLHHLGVENHEHSWFFGYIPEGGGAIAGFKMRFLVYSLPGGASNSTHRAEVLNGVDGAVFIADARPRATQHNLDRLLELEEALQSQGLEMAAIPMVLQVNHTDASDARPAKDVVFDLNPYGLPIYEAVASEGTGVLETHADVSGSIAARIRDNMAGNEAAITLTAVHRASRVDVESIIRAHLEAIRQDGHVPESSLDEGLQLSVDDFVSLPEGPRVDVAFHPQGMAGCKVVHVLDSHVQSGRALVDVVLDRETGGHPRRVTLVLENREIDEEERVKAPTPEPLSASEAATPPDHVTKDLPSVIPLTPAEEEGTDFPPWIYGLLGIGGGITVGLLAGFLLFY